MTPHYVDDWLTVYGGDCRAVLPALPAESVHCVVTSPPYWGLRDYGAEGQMGLEATPEEYVANMVDVFRAVHRVLRPDGTLWLNLGDSYAGSWGAQSRGNHTGDGKTTLDGHGNGLRMHGRQIAAHPQFGRLTGTRALSEGRKPKDLTGIPWMVAFALRSDGWYLRQDIIWSKPNPMPESVTDRPTRSHEYLFLMTKSPRYHFDADAVRERAESAGEVRGGGHKASTNGIHGNRSDGQRLAALGAKPTADTRNIRSVWTIPSQPYPGAHFAVFPPRLVEPCIKAGCPERGVVLDPFAGSGTVGVVAQRLSRRAVLVDLNPDYIRQQMARNAAIPLGLG